MKRLPLLLAVALLGCPTAEPVGDDDDASEQPTPEPVFGSTLIGGDRPATVVVPAGYDGLTAAPLVVLLHGYGANADLQNFYFRYGDRVDEDGFFLVLPNGTNDASGSSFWNARPSSSEPIDDVGYLMGLLDEMEDTWRVDPDRIYFAGHSNGGYMSYRLACEQTDRIAAVMNFAGLSPYTEEADCEAAQPLSMLHVHGTNDSQVPYAPTDGRMGAPELAALWASRAGCGAAPADGERLDLINGIAGDETRVQDWSGCEDNLAVSLWTLEEGGHLPLFNDTWAEQTLAWLLSQ